MYAAGFDFLATKKKNAVAPNEEATAMTGKTKVDYSGSKEAALEQFRMRRRLAGFSKGNYASHSLLPAVDTDCISTHTEHFSECLRFYSLFLEAANLLDLVRRQLRWQFDFAQRSDNVAQKLPETILCLKYLVEVSVTINSGESVCFYRLAVTEKNAHRFAFGEFPNEITSRLPKVVKTESFEIRMVLLYPV